MIRLSLIRFNPFRKRSFLFLSSFLKKRIAIKVCIQFAYCPKQITESLKIPRSVCLDNDEDVNENSMITHACDHFIYSILLETAPLLVDLRQTMYLHVLMRAFPQKRQQAIFHSSCITRDDIFRLLLDRILLMIDGNSIINFHRASHDSRNMQRAFSR